MPGSGTGTIPTVPATNLGGGRRISLDKKRRELEGERYETPGPGAVRPRALRRIA